MATDRDGLIASVYGGDSLKSAGLPFNPRWHNALPAGFSRWWLDPKSAEMGEAGRWYRYDVAEAKKLMEAAGYHDGFEVEYHYTNNRYGQQFGDQAEAVIAMAQAIGIKPKVMVEDYASRYFPETFIKGNFSGYANMLQTAFPTIGQYWRSMYLADGSRNHSKVDDPLMAELIQKQQVELDENTRRTIVHDLQRYASRKMYYVPLINGALGGYTMAWPWVGNFRAYRTAGYGGGAESVIHYWRRPS
jgi:ABC-type transport system substrate-binding protein